MSMSSYVVGFRLPDEQWSKMKAAWEACVAAKATIPAEVYDFFDGEDPSDRPGMEVQLGSAVRKYSADMRDGFEVDITKLPKGISIIRFINSY